MKLALILAFALFSGTAHAAINPTYQDIKLPTQQMIEKQSWAAPVAGASTVLSNGVAGPTSAAAATITSFAAQPDFPRNITITPGGTTGDVESCVITVSGTNYLNHAISETFTFSANATTVQTGAKAFKAVSSVAFPANCESGAFGATWYIGVGVKLGVKRCMYDAAGMLHGAVDGVKEATAPTMVADVDEVEKNTASFNTAPNAARNFDLYFMQNFRCVR